jgi:hypothetical protein
MCRGDTNAYAHRLSFEYKNFEDVFSIVKKWPLLVNFNIFHCGKFIFSQCSRLLLDMRLCRQVPDSPRDKNKMMHHPCLFGKVVFLASKTMLSPIGTKEKNFFINFKLYDLANGKE